MRTERLELRPYAPRDREDYIALVTDPDAMRHIEGGVVTADVAAAWWDRLVNGPYESGFRWCARSLRDSRYIGHAMINYSRPENACELGYTLPKNEWGKGYATEIAKALAEFSREEMGLKEIFGTVDEGFDQSIRVLEKAGMKFYGYDYDEQGRFLVYMLRH